MKYVCLIYFYFFTKETQYLLKEKSMCRIDWAYGSNDLDHHHDSIKNTKEKRKNDIKFISDNKEIRAANFFLIKLKVLINKCPFILD